MATGAGKNTARSLRSPTCDAAKLAKRVLFLLDRKRLVKQATNAFKGICRAPPREPARREKSGGAGLDPTYPTMMGLIRRGGCPTLRRHGCHIPEVMLNLVCFKDGLRSQEDKVWQMTAAARGCAKNRSGWGGTRSLRHYYDWCP